MGNIIKTVGKAVTSPFGLGAASGLLKGPSAPPAPDYVGAAKATAEGDLAAAKAATEANRINQYTPWGSLTYSKNADGTWNQVQRLDPRLQNALNSDIAVQQGQLDLSNMLQGQVANTMRNPLQTPDVANYINGVPQVNTNFSGFDPSAYGVGGVNQRQYNPMAFARGTQQVNQNLRTGANAVDQRFGTDADPLNQTMQSDAQGIDQNFGTYANPVNQNFEATAGRVDMNAPQFTQGNADAGASAAYGAATKLLSPQWEQDNKSLDNKLRLQGLTPGTEAYDNAMQNQLRVQAQQQSQMADQAVVTGNNMANQNYASALAGYQAGNQAQNQQYSQDANTFQLGNEAQNQAFGQDLSAFNANNAARGQQYSQDANTFQLSNDARNKAFNQDASAFQMNNEAQNQAYTQGANTFQLNNDARTQSLQNALALYDAQLRGQAAGNAAQGQAYDQALGAYTTGQQALANENAAQNQAYGQATNNYQLAYQQALQNYYQPLNALNSVRNGNQVQAPTFSNYYMQGQTNGPNMLGASQLQGQYSSGLYAQQSANRNALLGSLGQMGSAAMMAASDIRLKTNIRKIGITEGGHNWYEWDWIDGSGSATGVIAQEVAETIPHAVSYSAANDCLLVNYAAIK